MGPHRLVDVPFSTTLSTAPHSRQSHLVFRWYYVLVMDIPVRKSKRAKNMTIVVHPGGRWEVVIPALRGPSDRTIKRHVDNHREWIEKQVGRMSREKERDTLCHGGVARSVVENHTLQLIEATVLKMRRVHPVTIEKIRLGNWKRQWGSCSRGMTLGFHYKLSLLPTHLAEYIVAHELAHTTHFNHSRAFWELVERLCPNAKSCRKALRQFAL